MKRLDCFQQPFFIIIAFIFIFQAYCYAEGNEQYTYSQIIQLEDDTNKVLKLLSLSEKYKSNDFDSALFMASLAQNLSIRISYNKGKAEALYLKSVIYKNIGQLDSAIYFTNYSSEIFNQIDISTGIANNYNLYGSLLRRKGLLSSALENHKKSLMLFLKENDSIGLAKTYNYIGIIYKDLAKYDSAVVYYLKLISISERIKYTNGYIGGLLNTGQVYIELSEYNKARYYLKESIIANESIKNKKNIALAYNKLGMLEFYQENIDSAFYYFELAIQEYTQLESLYGIGYVTINIGNVFEQKNEYKKALTNYISSKEIFTKINHVSGILKANINIAVIYKKQGRFQKALNQYDACIGIAKEIGANDELLKIYDNIHKTYKLMGNSSKALEYQDKFIALKDSIFNLEKAKIITDLELKYEKEKNEARILALNNENLQQSLEIKEEAYRKNMYLAGGGLLLLISIFSVLYLRQRINKNKQVAEQKLLKADEEKKLVSAQSLLEGQEEERIRISKELHDGVGVLLSTATLYISNIDNISPSNKEYIDKANKLVDDANSDVREISRNLMPTILSTHGLGEALFDLIENIDNLPKMTGNFRVTGKSGRLSKPREVMVYRMIQELISNTMKHAQAKEVTLILDYQENDLVITYEDDGIGFDFEKELMKKSLGLKSIRSRVDYLKGRMDYNSELNQGSSYKIIIPISI